MSRRRKLTDTTPFDTLRLEGSLFVPELLERAARGAATAQCETDYAIPKGLKLHDEYGRAFRIATALWQDFAIQLPRQDQDANKTTHAFVGDFLRLCLGYSDLVLLATPTMVGDRGFPFTAQTIGGRLPIIIAPHHLGLDDPDPRFAIHGSGSRKKSAHQLAQEYLNASRDCLWAIVTNGRTLRLLRDAESLTRPNFLEFDLETILRESEDRYADFSALWRILHASRCGGTQSSSADPADCVWEKWKSEGHAQGLRIRDGLRDGVQEALLTLGRGFLSHIDNPDLRQRLQDGTLTKDEYFQQLLRLIYRNLFLFCAEERDLLHPPDIDPAARNAYATGYGLRRLRRRSMRQTAHDPHGDLWLSIRVVFRSLASGEPRLALPALGGLFAPTQCPDLDNASLTNRDLLAAMRPLRWFFDKKSGKRGAIDYRNMGPEELGSVYESLLELVPQLDLPARTFGFAGITDNASTSGNARKTTGSYYTPDSLVHELIKSALDPVIADRLAAQPDRPVEALLSITVCDPSCGSGHFLLAAARRLAEKLAELRASDGAVRPDYYRHALREVAGRCLYGVDINPMAVELCRVALWLETVDPGKPLGFLNHHIRTGNSLLGTTPDLIAAGLPDGTFTAIEGDDKPACAELKKRNKKEREGFGPLFEKEEQTIRDRLRLAATQIEAMDDSQPTALQQKEAAFTSSETAPEYRHAKLLADLWCAAFVIKKHYPASEGRSLNSHPLSQALSPVGGELLHTQDELFGHPTPAPAPKADNKKQPKTKNQGQGIPWGITTAHLRDFVQGKPLSADLQFEVETLALQYCFFHWHLAFPQVFDHGGFACILGNPPWERVKLQEKEWFASRDAHVTAGNASERQARIDALESEAPFLHAEFAKAKRKAEGEAKLARDSGKYPLCGIGDLNTYALFAELSYRALAGHGRAGLVLPTALITGTTTRFFFDELMHQKRLASFIGFDNEEKALFPSIDNNLTFAAVTIAGSKQDAPVFCFNIRQFSEVSDTSRYFRITDEDLRLFNPNTRTCPVFRSRQDALLAQLFYRKMPVFWQDGGTNSHTWSHKYSTMFHAKGAAHLFKDEAWLLKAGATKQHNRYYLHGSTFLPLYEAKMIGLYEHRWATFYGREMLDRPSRKYVGWYGADYTDPLDLGYGKQWVEENEVTRATDADMKWTIAFRNMTNRDLVRTATFCIIPKIAVVDSAPLIKLAHSDGGSASCFVGERNSFVADFVTRNKLDGTHLTYSVLKQLPVLPPATYAQPCPWANDQKSESANPLSLRDWLLARVLELTYTAWDLEAFAADCGGSGPPFRWDEERRFLLRCELDAAFFHLYLGPQDEWQQQPEALTRAFPTPRHAVSYIMDTFPIVKRKDESKHGHYRTKETILQIYDALDRAIVTGQPYQTHLTPPPADPACSHPSRTEATQVPVKHWQDTAFTLLAATRRKVHNYPLAVWPELIRQWDRDLDFETFLKAYRVLCEPAHFESEGRKLMPDLPAAWWKSRNESLEATDFIPTLKGSAMIGDLKIWRKDGVRYIRWTGTLPEGLVHEAVDDARIALQIASQWTHEAEWKNMEEIESLLQTIESS